MIRRVIKAALVAAKTICTIVSLVAGLATFCVMSMTCGVGMPEVIACTFREQGTFFQCLGDSVSPLSALAWAVVLAVPAIVAVASYLAATWLDDKIEHLP